MHIGLETGEGGIEFPGEFQITANSLVEALARNQQHTDPNNPSDEEDIVRVQDDFGR